MVVNNKHRSSSFIMDQDDPQSSSENGPDSPYSYDESRAIAAATTTTNGPSPKKRRGIQKRVVTVPMEVEGSRGKGEAYPPSDSWAWRKYGQKPIKGSPYPRGYYRCSSSKGCPARKQVERSRVDPTKLIITYACEHNHPLPTNKHHHHHHHTVATTTIGPSTVKAETSMTTSSDDPVDSADGDDPSSPLITTNLFGDSPRLEFVEDSLLLGNLSVDYSWISDVSFRTSSFVGPICDDVEVVSFAMKEEDESLFGDLDELPECSKVFRPNIERCTTSTPI